MLADASQTRIERRDPNALYQLNSLETIVQRAPGLDWAAYFAALGVAKPGEFNVAAPKFVAAVARAAAEAPLASLARVPARTRARRNGADAARPSSSTRASTTAAKSIQGLEKNFPRPDQVIRVMTGPFGSEPLAEGSGSFMSRARSRRKRRRARY